MRSQGTPGHRQRGNLSEGRLIGSGPLLIGALFAYGGYEDRPVLIGAEVMQADQKQKRYNSAMATIQVRNIPEDVHRVYRVRAAAAGQSLQEYLRSHLIEFAATATPAEIVAEVESEIAREGPDGFSTVPAADVIRQDRESH